MLTTMLDDPREGNDRDRKIDNESFWERTIYRIIKGKW